MKNKSDYLNVMIGSVNSPDMILDYIYKNENEIDFSYIDNKENSFVHNTLISDSGLGGGWAYDENALMKIVPELLKRNIENINAKNKKGETLIDLAVGTRFSMKLLKILLENGADIHQTKDLKKVHDTIEVCKTKYRHNKGYPKFLSWAAAQSESHEALMKEIDMLINENLVPSYQRNL
ncbi:MAG: hypothetical protein QM652_06340 [Legionella sp.]|uniref:hypothetical protein n=1 Tax=Legionella sp. TaxID=459 RepID=UPI0039E5818A